MDITHLLHHFLVPHEQNNHRAKALHHEALLAYILLLAVFNLGVRFFHTKAPDVLGYATDIRVEQLLTSTNAKRQAAGLPTLSLNATLSQAAAAKASDMFANNYWAHNNPAGKTPWDFIIAAGYKYTLAGENLAKNFDTSDGVVNAWMASPSHRDNLLKSGYRDVGFAVVNGVLNGEETTLVVQMFGATSVRPVAEVPKVQAAASLPVTKPEVVPEPVAYVTPVPAKEATPLASAPLFAGVKLTPLVDISSLSRDVVYVFVGILMGVLAVDAYVVSRRHIVRLAGHNVAHMLFFGSMILGGLFITRGSLI